MREVEESKEERGTDCLQSHPGKHLTGVTYRIVFSGTSSLVPPTRLVLLLCKDYPPLRPATLEWIWARKGDKAGYVKACLVTLHKKECQRVRVRSDKSETADWLRQLRNRQMPLYNMYSQRRPGRLSARSLICGTCNALMQTALVYLERPHIICANETGYSGPIKLVMFFI